ncbi:MAG: N-acetylmuramate alpha-1-phosphate uridylyltransferase MurU [Gammaproteobacteria bacterium]
MKAMILAAGRGERMRPMTDTTPKPLLKVGGRTLIEHHIAALARAGVDDLVINLAWQGGSIRDFIGNGAKYGVKIAYSEEPAGALETGGGIRQALPLLGTEPFWVVNGDVYCEFDYAERRLAERCSGHLVLVPNPAHNRAGDFGLDGDLVVESSPDSLTYSGIAVLSPGLFAGSPPGRVPLAPLLIDAVRRAAVTGEVFRGRWVDVGTPARLAALDRALGRATT